jgi:hypothetical protein
MSELDPKLIKHFINYLKENGKRKKVSIDQIKTHYKNINKRLTTEKIKSLVQQIRTKEHIIISSKKYFLMSDNNGIWLSKDINELETYAQLIEERANDILTIKQAITKYLITHRPKPDTIENQSELF